MDILSLFSIQVEKCPSGKICIVAPRVYLTEQEFEEWVQAIRNKFSEIKEGSG